MGNGLGAGTGTIVQANQAFLKMTGYTKQDVESCVLTWRKLTTYFVGESEAQLEKLAKTGKIGPYKKEYFAKMARTAGWVSPAATSAVDPSANCVWKFRTLDRLSDDVFDPPRV